LLNAGCKTIGDVANRTAEELLNTRHFGKVSLLDVEIALAVIGLRLGMPKKETSDEDNFARLLDQVVK
jgi:DNA-directed RNA polymerase alpha subunit